RGAHGGRWRRIVGSPTRRRGPVHRRCAVRAPAPDACACECMRVLVPEPDQVWGVDFARDDGTGGFLRLLQLGDRCWCWAYLVGPSIGLVVVRDPDVAPPRRTELIDVRADGLWMELLCETPGEHWTYGVEAFAV